MPYSSTCKDCGERYPSGTSCDCKDKIKEEVVITKKYHIDGIVFNSYEKAKEYLSKKELSKTIDKDKAEKDFLKLVKIINQFTSQPHDEIRYENIKIDGNYCGFRGIDLRCDDNKDYPISLFKVDKKDFLSGEKTLEGCLSQLKRNLKLVKTTETYTDFNHEQTL